MNGHTQWSYDCVYGVHRHACADAHEMSLHEHDCDYALHKLIRSLQQSSEEERLET